MSNFERPPFVLAFMADTQGCGTHRILMPLAALVETGAVDGRVDMALCPDHIIATMKPDVIVWQRQVEDGQIEVMERWRKLLPDTLFVFELDDYLSGVPRASFHASFMPPNIEGQLRRAIAVCDRVVTTTEILAKWFDSLGARDVRVAPNAVPVGQIKEHEQNPADKLRIGFAGGMSHAGDLELLRPAMTEIGDKVTWVFFGTQPENPAAKIEFIAGQPATTYLQTMTQLGFDLMLAPLEDNHFNRCKSNLRLVESGCAGAPVIAQDMSSYHLDDPPVFAFARTPADWTREIWRFIAMNKAARQKHGDALRSWVGRHYTLERRVRTWMTAWLHDTKTHWRPKPAKDKLEPVVLAVAAPDTRTRTPFLSKFRQIADLEEACRKALLLGTGVLWLRPATTFVGFDALQKALDSAPDIAAVIPLASDGPNSFPQDGQWSPLPPSTVEILAQQTTRIFDKRTLSVVTPSGPVVWLSPNALGMLGLPDVAGCDGNEEQAILEWGLRAKTRNWKTLQVLDTFAASLASPAQPSQDAVNRVYARGYSNLLRQPSEILTADEREQLEARLISSQWGGPRPGSMGFSNDYEAWSLLHDLQSRPHLPEFAYDVETRWLGSEGVVNASWVVFIDDQVELYPNALKHIQTAIANVSPAVYVIYGDSDTVTENKKVLPEFKPDFDLELFLAQDYISTVCAIRCNDEWTVPHDRADLFKELLLLAHDRGSQAFYHIPRVLGRYTLPATPEALALETLSRQLAVREVFGDEMTVEASRALPGCLIVKRILSEERPLVSIIIPTLGVGRLIQPCVATIQQHTEYPNYEIIVVQNGAREAPELADEVLADPRVRVVNYPDEFNWSALNNWTIRNVAAGNYIVTLNDDTCVATKNWLGDLLAYAMCPGVGAVGARLLHPMGVYQHVGVVCHNGIAGHVHKTVAAGQAGHLGRAMLTHEASAVTGACMMFCRTVFEAVGGFDETFSHNYNDTVFCLRLQDLSLRNVVVMSAELLHTEGASRQADTPEGIQRLIEDSAHLARTYNRPDPYWNPNMTLAYAVDNKVAITGLNADILAWSDFEPRPGHGRVLLINDQLGDKGRVLDILRAGDAPFAADLSGFTLKLTMPQAINVRSWDVRKPERLIVGLQALGITRVVLRSLIGHDSPALPVETFRTLVAIKDRVTITVDPIDQGMMLPWKYGSKAEIETVFGYVDMHAWKNAYDKLEVDEYVC